MPWNGAREYKLIVNSRQQKFICVVVQGKWYSTDGSGADTHTKRNLRSTADRPELTLNEYFGIVDNEGPSHRRHFKALVKRTEQPPSPAKPPRRPAAPRKARFSTSPVPAAAAPTTTTAAAAADEEAPTPAPPPVHRASGRVRRKVSPSDRAPRIVSQSAAPAGPPAAEAATAPIAPAPGPGPAQPTHARNRSSSAQSSASADTVVVAVRSPSVASVETVVAAPASPGKRKREDDEGEALDADAGEVKEGMVTRHRATRSRAGDSAERSEPPSRIGTPAVEPRAKVPRARPRAKKARV